nr:hypothetical protein pmam_111 [Pithovirus mammoth]
MNFRPISSEKIAIWSRDSDETQVRKLQFGREILMKLK